ncbi:MAG: DNA-3-methyladenine glycosylase [Candidatus Woesearchaeota archaeon]
MKPLPKDFFKRDTVKVARELVGKILQVGNKKVRIVETEAYKQDKASHARKKTPRSELMWTTQGHVYVYMIYGMYFCLNITTDVSAGAVLIRAAESEDNSCSGPGKLCKTLNITIKDNKAPLGKRIKILDDGFRPKIVATTRVGIREDTHLPWRFYIKGNSCVSKK